ncbi:hypothetical protein FRB94_011501 [Tulasnella sp. JGI-2019a]|nr:hypothetical protein FRB93_009026 [Tulasnella sp. JGI-2019a]KAG8992559.1 hypothetical protein FRB94_011501 [Tulasnella sp. JGI-2019a]
MTTSQPARPATSSARDIVLDTTELLLRIFERLSSKELVVAALVCKRWSSFAIDTKWRFRSVKFSRLLKVLYNEQALPKLKAEDNFFSVPIQTETQKVKNLKLDVLVNATYTASVPVCPFLEALELEVAQVWLWDNLGYTMKFLRGEGHHGLVSLVLHKRQIWLWFTQEHCEVLGKSIPNLQKLVMKQTATRRLNPPPGGACTHETTCSLDGLITLARYSGTVLTHLTASLVVEPPAPELFEAPQPDTSLSALRSLTLQHLGVTADLVDWLSEFLVRLCPNLESFEIGCFMIKQGHEGWTPISSESLKMAYFFHQRQLLQTCV